MSKAGPTKGLAPWMDAPSPVEGPRRPKSKAPMAVVGAPIRVPAFPKPAAPKHSQWNTPATWTTEIEEERLTDTRQMNEQEKNKNPAEVTSTIAHTVSKENRPPQSHAKAGKAYTKQPEWDIKRMFKHNEHSKWNSLPAHMKTMNQRQQYARNQSDEGLEGQSNLQPRFPKWQRTEITYEQSHEEQECERTSTQDSIQQELEVQKNKEQEETKYKKPEKKNKEVEDKDTSSVESIQVKAVKSQKQRRENNSEKNKEYSTGMTANQAIKGLTAEEKQAMSKHCVNLVQLHHVLKNLKVLSPELREELLESPWMPWMPPTMFEVSMEAGKYTSYHKIIGRIVHERGPKLMHELVKQDIHFLTRLKAEQGTRRIKSYCYQKFGLNGRELAEVLKVDNLAELYKVPKSEKIFELGQGRTIFELNIQEQQEKTSKNTKNTRCRSETQKGKCRRRKMTPVQTKIWTETSRKEKKKG